MYHSTVMIGLLALTIIADGISAGLFLIARLADLVALFTLPNDIEAIAHDYRVLTR